MRLSRAALATIAIAVALTGCIENMGDLKETLGVHSVEVLPTYEPPLAKMQANATSVLAGAPVRFLSEGSRDPQGLPLAYRWDLGDGTKRAGPVATHSYVQPGEYLARLTVINAEGLTDEDALTIRVTTNDLAPSAAVRAPERARMGESVAFEAVASDPEGGPLSYEWDFGDGATSHDARPAHAFAAPGAYDITLEVTDRAGLAATSGARVLVDGAWEAVGAFEPGGPSAAPTTIPVPEGARRLEAKLSFPAGLGLNDLVIVALDADGNEVERSEGATAPAAQDDQVRSLVVAGEALAKPGAWTLEVRRASGVSVEWTLQAVLAL